MKASSLKVKLITLVFLFSMVSGLYLPVSDVQADSSGKPFLHPIFSDHMVLQREVENNIWGWASPGEKITVELGGNVSTCTAASDGRWQAKLLPFSKGGPYELKVSGKTTVTLKDIFFGEVWLCAGQSNMAMQLPFVLNGDTEAKNSTNPNIRFFTTPYGSSSTPVDTFGYVSSWYQCSPDTVGNLSGAAYFFARELNAGLDVPIGIICSAVGGTQIESWISNEAFARFKAENNVSGYNPGSVNVYYNGMIAPLKPVKFKGVLWYQGESNTQFDYLYEKQLKTLVSDWRTGLGLIDAPFIIVQLPNYLQKQTSPVESVPWTTVREAQAMVAQSDKNIGLVTTIDIGEEDIHPKNKQDLGKRAALCALGKFYNRNITYSGPVYSGITKENGRIRLHFKNTAGGLMAGIKTGLEPVRQVSDELLKGFAIAGSNGIYVWADAVIDGDSILVGSSAVSQPETVRYAWANNPTGNLYNRAGFPASPFRTDQPLVVTPVITGDLNADEQVDAIDFSLLKMHLLGQRLLEGDALAAADMDFSGSVDVLDLAQLKKYLLGIG
ncbi:endo-1,4-beta-xylanase Z precursor [Ruminiclostridium hungatei]|uniref:cellulase n=1 Tax=Ruminiclostridium hungatei TaxID=48256 RepID=A0A1V4SEW3_RUMHU|nr:sialate O-acetylesterase [Ruminiclostridium hungatei]OPX42283.1 endo-1,4-beta-xylanase Z precursor [Ruminiclostridium hungatei]